MHFPRLVSAEASYHVPSCSFPVHPLHVGTHLSDRSDANVGHAAVAYPPSWRVAKSLRTSPRQVEGCLELVIRRPTASLLRSVALYMSTWASRSQEFPATRRPVTWGFSGFTEMLWEQDLNRDAYVVHFDTSRTRSCRGTISRLLDFSTS